MNSSHSSSTRFFQVFYTRANNGTFWKMSRQQTAGASGFGQKQDLIANGYLIFNFLLLGLFLGSA